MQHGGHNYKGRLPDIVCRMWILFETEDLCHGIVYRCDALLFCTLMSTEMIMIHYK